MSEKARENLSALMDGELEGAEAVRLLNGIIQDSGLKTTWEQYHLISDALRNNLPPVAERDLLDRVRLLVDSEPVVLRRSAVWKTSLRPVAGFALAASVAVVAVLGFRGITQEGAPGRSQTIARIEPQVVPGRQIAGVRWNLNRPAVEARLNDYLVSHSQHSGTVMQGMLPYARIVGYNAGR